MNFLPFDYLVVANRNFDIDSLTETVSFFSAHGIRKFIFLLNFDRTRSTVSQIKARQKNLDQSLRSLGLKGVTLHTSLCLDLSDGIVYDPSLELIFNRSEMLFVNLPLFCDESWVDNDLNYLLFKKKKSPILTSLEGTILTSSQDRINQIFHSKFYRLALDLNYLTSLDAESRVMQIISREIPVIPCISHDVSNYVGIVNALESLKYRLGTDSYVSLTRNFLENEKPFFSQVHYCTK